MGSETNLPNKVGELAEAKTFEEGFRGAWFHCKIRGITKKKGGLQYLLEYYDFPDEGLDWTSIYQVPPYHVGRGREKHRELILRPPYPPIYNEKQMPHVSEIAEVTVIVANSWKVGDLVDWWASDCYWSGSITQLLGDGKAQIELKPPPFGEGLKYTAFLKDMRPSLDWSPEHGWTIPTQEGVTGPLCVRLIKPTNRVTEETRNTAQETNPIQCSPGSSVCLSYSAPLSSDSAISDERKQSTGETVGNRMEKTSKRSQADGDSSRASVGRCLNCAPLKSTRSDTLEAAVMDLEEYLNKVKWLKKVLQYGFSSCDERPQWEVVDPNSASGIPK